MAENTPAFAEGMDYVILEDAVRRLMVDVMKTLTAIKPDVLIEFRQSYIGPVMREFGNMFRVGDCPFTTSTNRIGMVDIRLLCGDTAAHSDMLAWHVNDRVENAVCQIENVLFSTVQFSARLDRVPEEPFDIAEPPISASIPTELNAVASPKICPSDIPT